MSYQPQPGYIPAVVYASFVPHSVGRVYTQEHLPGIQGAVHPARAVPHSAAVAEDPPISRYSWVERVLLAKVRCSHPTGPALGGGVIEQVHLAFGVVVDRLSERGVVCLVPWP